jgi:BirA family biotin operon repressor/biotin-[acetyl-CoA-carboxylase] ligase
MSIALQPTFLEPAQPFLLSASVALAVHDFFSDYAGDETKIKWPNDLYWRDRKAGGILIENLIGSNSSSGKDNQKPSTAGNIKWSIIGIGININQTYFPDFLPNPVSLKQITGKTFDTFQLAGELQQKVLNRFEQLKTEGFHNIYEAYIKESYRMHQPQKFKKENRVLEATIKNITPAGQLVLQHAIEEVYDFGEVEWVTLKNT